MTPHPQTSSSAVTHETRREAPGRATSSPRDRGAIPMTHLARAENKRRAGEAVDRWINRAMALVFIAAFWSLVFQITAMLTGWWTPVGWR